MSNVIDKKNSNVIDLTKHLKKNPADVIARQAWLNSQAVENLLITTRDSDYYKTFSKKLNPENKITVEQLIRIKYSLDRINELMSKLKEKNE